MMKSTIVVQSPTSSFSVLEFYQNKSILITGITGFIGKILLEKLLRECRSLKRIYVLIREKKSQTAKQRLAHILSTCSVFESHQDKIDLVEPINGDITVDGLGLSVSDREKLINEIDIVFHSAATVKFTGIMKEFIQNNIEGTAAILKLCQQMIKLQSIVYVSTAYSNSQRKEIEEKIYPVVEDQDFDSYFDYLKKNYFDLNLESGHEILAGRPNPYTLSKAIAEWMIQEHYQSLPIIICRPSIVGHSLKEPFPGWCDSFSGYFGAFLLASIGVLRTIICNYRCKTEIIPVDLVTNSLIVAGAYRGSPLYNEERKVVHLISGSNSITWKEILQHTLKLQTVLPSMKVIRPISLKVNSFRTMKERIEFKITSLLSHYLFAVIFDLICLIMGQKPFLVKIIKRIENALNVLKPFLCNEWKFHYKNNNFISSLMKEEERALFITDVSCISWPEYLYNSALGTRRYQLKDPDSTLENARRRYYRIQITFKLVQYVMFFLLIVFVIGSIAL